MRFWTLIIALLWGTPLGEAAAPQQQPENPVNPMTKWDAMDIGTFQSYGLEVPEAERVWRPALKGLNIRVGPKLEAAVCYDTERMRFAAAWSGGFLKLPSERKALGGVPQPAGKLLLRTAMAPGWAGPRGEWNATNPPTITSTNVFSMGPLSREWAKWRGHYRNGHKIVLSYSVGATDVLEMPGFDPAVGGIFIRWFNIRKADQAHVQHMLVAEESGAIGVVNESGFLAELEKNGMSTIASVITRGGLHDPYHELETKKGRITYRLERTLTEHRFGIAIWRGPKTKRKEFMQHLEEISKQEPPQLEPLTKGGPSLWSNSVTTQGVMGKEEAAYTVDTLTLPQEKGNPWNSWIRCGGFDFFKNGTSAALCSVTGDVWVVGGINGDLKKLHWRRFATGLFQPLGLKIVEETVYVLGRDQITRLHDLNKDGEADFYENFNNDISISNHYHEFCLNLETDSEGNFYFTKGSNLGPATIPHHGTLLKVNSDGSKLERLATGHLSPNGLSVGPKGEITTSDNEGHWMPTSRINIVERGGFYGNVHTAHKEPLPTTYRKPLLWIPHKADNSSGGQVWVNSTKWGPFEGGLVHLSYGRAWMFIIMREDVAGQHQGGAVRLPVKFESGVMRGRFNPLDGQLYVVGLNAWQTGGVKDGTFQRVRYTGKPANLPSGLQVRKDGLEITFTDPLDALSAVDDGNYSVKQWNYKWTQAYGSKLYSVKDPTKVLGDKGQNANLGDPLAIKSVRLSDDKRTIFLQIEGLKPVMQSRIQYDIKSDDGVKLKQEIFHTINRVPTQ